ncbi:MAG: prolyl oligopeptidase family serine peptidase [Deltaproteobacteria bacterium]|nr:prolyl oligopeptidase family serine peptidase [Deltaproteobacteria bacterium]
MKALILSALVLVTACSSSENDTTSGGSGGGGASATSASTGAGTGGSGGAAERPVKVVVPESYDGSEAVPLVVLLHGYSASGLVQEAYFKLSAQAEKHGFIYAIPEGTVDKLGMKFWNASDACCDFNQSKVDDSAFLAGFVDELSSTYKIDPKRVFFIGHSNGGFMSYRMACDHADKIAAIVSLAGAMPADAVACKASEPVAVLQIHGTEDGTIDYAGGKTATKAYPGAKDSVLDWVATNGCSPTPESGEPLDLESKLEGTETKVERYPGCKPGGAAELWTMEKGGHLPSLTPDFAVRTIEFLLAHPKP